ncbi:sensor histidine kinase [Parvularcula dongshanensis]|uniref:histidine kinase n=1 Tax=Parvularcula dongshanensis TaxID=1173995 RepID=A0A840I048_9PROT|nr:histidine kinase dimerization/phosphoacceptor domain -containing protein [Parvularcula dongshanensis]MBB4657725.1 PAS domain S-box-containing protein [Parvularcula dongshanensis]
MPVQNRKPDDANEAALALLGANSTSFLKGVLDASPDCIKIVELDGTLSFMNENGRCAMEIDDFCAVDGAEWPSLWPDDQQPLVESAISAARRGEARRFEAFCPTAKGAPRWWDVSVAPVFGKDGTPERIVSISRDVTNRVERERAVAAHEAGLERLALAQATTLQEKEQLLREKDLLMREVDHRVKNSLGLVGSLLGMQGRTEEDTKVRGALSRASQRVGTIAAIHDRLYRSEASGELDFASYLNGLCADLAASVAGADVRIEVTCDPVTMRADRATVLGLIVSEFVTNAVRHAFGPDGGTIRVVLQKAAVGYRLTVADDGCGLPDGFDPAAAHGLGMRVVASYAARNDWHLEASNQGGARFSITLR